MALDLNTVVRRALSRPVAGSPEALPEALGGTLSAQQWINTNDMAQPDPEQTPENGYGVAPNLPTRGVGSRGPGGDDTFIAPGTEDLVQGRAAATAERRQRTIQQAEAQNSTGSNPLPLGNFASQFAYGGQGPKSYTHSLRPERGKVVR